jgi:hypothetical protein
VITIARLIVRCYPRSWRERYGPEMRALLTDTPPEPRDIVDLLRGCGSAWLFQTELGFEVRVLAGIGAWTAFVAWPASLVGSALRNVGVNTAPWPEGISILLLFALILRQRVLGRRPGSPVATTPVPANVIGPGRIPAAEARIWRGLAIAIIVLHFASDAAERPASWLPPFHPFLSVPAMSLWLIDLAASTPWFMPVPQALSRPPGPSVSTT